MPSEQTDPILAQAAEMWGITPEYWDIWGRKHVTSPETIRAILKAMDVPAGSSEQVAEAIRERRRKEWKRLLPPCLVTSENNERQELYLNVPAEIAASAASIQVRTEAGARKQFSLETSTLSECAAEEVDGIRYVRKQFRLPFPLAAGYHDVEASAGSLKGSMRLIVTPDRAYAHPALEGEGRAAGIAIALYGVRSAINWGCGDLRDLRGIIDWAVEDGQAGFIALNPLHAIHNRRPFNASPYLPNSIFYQNFIYLNVEGIEDFDRSGRARRLWSTPEIRSEVAALRAAEFVEYERVAALKLRFLKLCFLEFLRRRRQAGEQDDGFGEFISREGDLLDRFATYCALDEHLHRRHPDMWTWQQWPAPYRRFDSPETAAFQQKHRRSVMFYKYIQWQLDRQLTAANEYARAKGLAIGLYHDLALATDRFGSDLWAHREFYVSGCRVGAPPDDFAPKGQDWAFPPPRSEWHWETGYELFAESVRKNCRHGGALRIDHVMRFFRLYWIPEGVDATAGAYVEDRYEDLLRILALESVRHRVVIVGEDLGTVEPVMREILARFNILSYRLFYFEKNRDGSFKEYREYPRQALVSSTTHDLPTLAGFWIGEDIEARKRAGLFPGDDQYREQRAARTREKQQILDLLFRLDLLPGNVPRSAGDIPELTGDLHNAIIGFLALTPSQLLLINHEDLTKEIAQQNLPATTSQYPNWSHKMKFTVEQLRSDPMARGFTAMFREWLARSGRLNRR